MSHLESCCPLDLDHEWNTLQRVGGYLRLEFVGDRQRQILSSEFPTMVFSNNKLLYENKKHAAIRFLLE